MRRSARFTYILFIILLVPNLVHAEEQKNDLSLTLEQCILRTVEKNLNVAVEILNPEMAKWNLTLASERFLPQLSFEYGNQSTVTPSFSWIDAAGDVNSQFIDQIKALKHKSNIGFVFQSFNLIDELT
ncbi:hypothetical protein ACFLT9_09315, partial [Acidobacteriota bacterium]